MIPETLYAVDLVDPAPRLAGLGARGIDPAARWLTDGGFPARLEAARLYACPDAAETMARRERAAGFPLARVVAVERRGDDIAPRPPCPAPAAEGSPFALGAEAGRAFALGAWRLPTPPSAVEVRERIAPARAAAAGLTGARARGFALGFSAGFEA